MTSAGIGTFTIHDFGEELSHYIFYPGKLLPKANFVFIFMAAKPNKGLSHFFAKDKVR
jgi:hypothetical protein